VDSFLKNEANAKVEESSGSKKGSGSTEKKEEAKAPALRRAAIPTKVVEIRPTEKHVRQYSNTFVAPMMKGAPQATATKPEAAVEPTGQEMDKQRDERASPEIQPMIEKYALYANEPLRKESKSPKETSPLAKQAEDQANTGVQQDDFVGITKPGEPDDSSHLDE
jgi:hypothetical protein